ncbi:MAG TPA: AbrB/MazE/SpoVT family DNA-binding domain-containing protein [Ktedonobacteraceae bacterium]|nr:AbrB/MazE/SpoVT family DNA-binding domain-containing protein [Ktedonobacteraceae bacterium]
MMQVVKLHKVGDAVTVTLPDPVLEALQLHEDDEVAIEVAEDHIVLTKATQDFQDAWAAYEKIEPRYSNANRKLGE